MIRNLIVWGAMALAAAAADDAWSKVKEVKSGTELKIFRKDAKQPMLVKMDEATDDSLIVLLKNEQISISKDQIERIDARPAKGRVIRETKTVVEDPGAKVNPPNRPHEANIPTTSSSSGLSIGSKPEFELLYRRSAASPK